MRFRESYWTTHSFCSVNAHSGPFRVVLRLLRWWVAGAEEGGIVCKGCRPGSGLATVRILEKELSLHRHSGHLTLDFCWSVIFTSTLPRDPQSFMDTIAFLCRLRQSHTSIKSLGGTLCPGQTQNSLVCMWMQGGKQGAASSKEQVCDTNGTKMTINRGSAWGLVSAETALSLSVFLYQDFLGENLELTTLTSSPLESLISLGQLPPPAQAWEPRTQIL